MFIAVTLASSVPTACGAAEIWPEGRGFNSHPGRSFSLSLGGPISISRANAHMVHVG